MSQPAVKVTVEGETSVTFSLDITVSIGQPTVHVGPVYYYGHNLRYGWNSRCRRCCRHRWLTLFIQGDNRRYSYCNVCGFYDNAPQTEIRDIGDEVLYQQKYNPNQENPEPAAVALNRA